LHADENNEKRRAGGRGSAKKFVKCSGAWLDESGDALRMFCIGEAFKKAIGGAERREGDFGPVDEGSQALAVAFAGFAEEDGLDGAAGA
jgi:hypothetical protein